MKKSSKILAALLFCGISIPWSLEAAGGKSVVIDKGTQTLRAYENGNLVFQSRVSTGRAGRETPNGRFHAQGKKRMHYSSLYDNAPMPYSVPFSNNYFIHGFSSVPPYPASHGCVRMPLSTAPVFFNWVTPGTPISVVGSWKGGEPRQERRRHFRSAQPRKMRYASPAARPNPNPYVRPNPYYSLR